MGFLVTAIYAFLLAPVLIIVFTSFNPTNANTFPPTGFSLRWYGTFLETSGFTDAFRFSMWLGAISAVGATVIGFLSAYAIVRFLGRRREAGQSLALLPVMIPHILISISLLLALTIVPFPELGGLIVGHIIICLPFTIAGITASLEGVDEQLELAAMTLGASRLRTLWEVVIPLIAPGLLSALIFAFIVSFGDVYIALFPVRAGAHHASDRDLLLHAVGEHAGSGGDYHGTNPDDRSPSAWWSSGLSVYVRSCGSEPRDLGGKREMDEIRVGTAVSIAPGVSTGNLRTGDMPDGAPIAIPVAILRGEADGPTLWLHGCVHGDELCGTYIIHETLRTVNPADLKGTIVALPMLNVTASQKIQRMSPFELFGNGDLNRNFPGDPDGLTTQQMAYHIYRPFAAVRRLPDRFPHRADRRRALGPVRQRGRRNGPEGPPELPGPGATRARCRRPWTFSADRP